MYITACIRLTILEHIYIRQQSWQNRTPLTQRPQCLLFADTKTNRPLLADACQLCSAISANGKILTLKAVHSLTASVSSVQERVKLKLNADAECDSHTGLVCTAIQLVPVALDEVVTQG